MLRRYRFIAPFTLAYMAIGLGISLSRGNSEFLFYGAVMAVLIAFVVAVDARVRFPQHVLWLLAIWGMMHMFGGTLPIPESVTEPGKGSVLYNLRLLPWLPKYDQITHAFGFFSATVASWHAIQKAAGGALRPTFGPLMGAALMGMGLGATNEVVEFVAVLLIPETNVGGYINTGWDLVSNMVGAVGGAVFVGMTARRQPIGV